ncbi:response regulator [Paraflavisolibacter sp. H34]|uniref:sensor histidine kinase n=1 Tax=Huijunlia imazamoxiresistens TaxID=3127457 RepID=UPI003019966B
MQLTTSLMKKPEIKILVVDDREDNLLSIETILERDGYTLVKATSGRAALKILLQDQDFTLILMDVQMPGMSGLETAALIYERDKLKHIPIIFITAFNYDEGYIYQGYRNGGVDYIYKPINPELLRMKVSVFVELYRKTHELLQHEKKLLAANANLAREIEERKLNEEKVRQLNQQLMEKNAHLKSTIEDLDRFAYVASHDLQEPLRKITLFSDRITIKYKDQLDEGLSSNLEKITQASKRMNLLIRDLLKFSRNTIRLSDFQYINLNDLVQDVLADIEVEIEKSQAIVEVVDLPHVWGVPSQMQQLFQNLIHNALKFRKKEVKPQIRIYADCVEAQALFDDDRRQEDGRFYRIYVQDNGIGFDPKYAQEIFVVFKRLHNYQEYEGTGVGLSICKKIVEGHNGIINVQSKPNEGATFIICIPEKVSGLVSVA